MKLTFVILFSFLTSSNMFFDHKELAATYINSFKDVAIMEMQRTGIPASIKLAQGLLESDWGRSDLANKANNHFGIKCGGKWKGDTFYKEDDDRNNRGELIKSCFRSFDSALESYMAHSEFLKDPKKSYRYGFLFDYDATDYKSWARGLKKSGYATDPKYPNKLISIIEKYNLHQFDMQGVKFEKVIASHTATSETKIRTASKTTKNSKIRRKVEKETKRKIKSHRAERNTRTHKSRLVYDIEIYNSCRMVSAKGGETLEDIAHKVGLSVDELITFNEIYKRPQVVLKEDENIFLEKKKRSFKGSDYHLVQEGETMKAIAQKYGIRLKSLYAKNRMPKNSETVAGQKLRLSNSASLSERPRFKLKDSKRKHKYLFEETK